MPAQGKPLAQWQKPDRRIEVNRVIDDDGTSRILLQDMSFGPGVGWYVQKTIELDGEQVDALLRKLCCNRSEGCGLQQKPQKLTQPAPLGQVANAAIIDFKEAAGGVRRP